MRVRSLLVMATLIASGGCRTHLNLQKNTIHTTNTLTDINYQQVLNNVALATSNASSMPSVSVINAGTVTVADQKTVSVNAATAPTVSFGQQAGAGMPILSLLFNPSASRTLTENWSMTPVTDIDNLRRIRCALQYLVLRGRQTTDCEQCVDLLNRFYLGESDRIECLVPLGWYRTGRKKDVPRDACYVGHYGDTYAWVGPDGVEGLTRFTMTVLDLATGKPHAPMKTVVKTYKSDGSLDNTQVTTTEIDQDALASWKRNHHGEDRPRQYANPPVVNPGLFFVPR
jgi:hypothetical protein